MTVNNNEISALLDVMRRLRDPQTGCPWDVAQDFNSIAPYTIEEAYEVADAIARNEMGELRDELGDLLFQVVFHARMAEERDEFAFADVVNWEDIKAGERAARGGDCSDPMADIPLALDALQRAAKIQKRASQLGFDWTEVPPVVAKLREEIDELEVEITTAATRDRMRDELGDVLFSVVNLARHLQIDPAGALVNANCRFEQRFAHVCEQAGGAEQLKTRSADELETLWQQAKRHLANDKG
jgi:uncharacterized protein YabN with tetrapyrrole methylase and pyrophosphatase domain